jgi:hypothetical protein
MRRGTIVVIVFILVVAGIIGVSQFFRSQPPLELTVAVDPLGQAWIENAVKDFNATDPVVNGTRRISLRVITIKDLDVWQGKSGWNSTNHPSLWIPSSSLTLNAAVDGALPVASVSPSTARTPLVWGGFASRVDVITKQGAMPLDWDTVAAAAKGASWSALSGQDNNWGFVNLAFNPPDSQFAGLMSLMTGAAAFSKTPTIMGDTLRSNDFRSWLLPVLQSIKKNQAGGPAAAMAVGPSNVQLGLFPESQWLTNLPGMQAKEAVQLSYPAYQFQFDFPLARWEDSRTLPEEQAAATAFSNWLLSAAQQAKAADFGLRPVNGEPSQLAGLFVAAATSGVQITPSYGQPIQLPPRSEVQGLVQWIQSNQ